MKSETPYGDEEVWVYVHGEMAEAARPAFERRLEGDADLRRRTAAARRLHHVLRASLPASAEAEPSDERLAEAALAAWERDQAAAATPCLPCAPVAARRPRPWFARPAALGWIGLAAALLIAVTHPAFLTPHEPRWTSPQFHPLLFRGDPTELRPEALDGRDARKAQAALAAALTRAVANRGLTLPAGLTLSLQMRELRAGTFSVTVQARLRDGSLCGDWDGDYSSVERFLASVDTSAARLAEALAARPFGSGE